MAEDVARLREDAVEDPPDGEGDDSRAYVLVVRLRGGEGAIGPVAACPT